MEYKGRNRKEMATGKSGFVTLIGRPNVGKSTLMNHLIGQKIAITSKKPQTTRNRIRTVYTDKRGQIVFTDTPGVTKMRNKLGEYMLQAATGAIQHADAVLWLSAPTDPVEETEKKIAALISRANIPVVLVINKTDRFTRDQIEEQKKSYEGLMNFSAVLEVSALRNIGMEKVLDKLFSLLQEGPLYYEEDTLTDQPMRQIAAEIVREKALRSLGQEVPHAIAVLVDRMQPRPDGRIIDVEAEIICERESHKGIIIGKNGAMLKRIGTEARLDMEKLLEAKVNLKIWVKVRKDWRDSDLYLRNYGYDQRNLE